MQIIDKYFYTMEIMIRLLWYCTEMGISILRTTEQIEYLINFT